MCRVLILDDELYFARSIAETLKRAGGPERYRTSVFTQVPEALQTAKNAAASGKPFEILLIDQRLESELDGIEVMQELRRISPESDAIIFTGFDSVEDGLKAYEAGAFRYLPKMFDRKELLFIMRLLRQQRKEQREYGWQVIFGQMVEEALQKNTFHEAAHVVVLYSLRLGFERAHLLWLPNREHAHQKDCLVGICGAERNSEEPTRHNTSRDIIENFTNQLYPLRNTPYFQQAEDALSQHDAVFFRGDSLHLTRGSMQLHGFHLPHSEWAVLPIWTGSDFRGILLLDFGQSDRSLAEHERTQLNLFARQVSVVLERARLFEQEARSRQEENIIRTIGQEITTRAALDDLLPLLEEVRRQVGKLMDVNNFIIVLKEEETRQVDFRLQYERGQRSERHKRPANQGLSGYLLEQNEVLFIPDHVKEFREQRGIPLYGTQAQSWLGVPLRVSNNVIGGIIVQNYDQPHTYTERDKRLLMAVAEQVAGAIQISRLAEMEREDTERMRVLQRASLEMLRIASQKEDLRQQEEMLWFIVLTIATSNFGTRFNRALLFLAENGYEHMVGKMGIGTEDHQAAQDDWERDEKRHYSFEIFLQELAAGVIRHTPFESLVKECLVKLEGNDAFRQVMQSNQRIAVSSDQILTRLPTDFNQRFAFSECVVLPLRAGDTAIGVVVVDNKHDGKAPQEKMLNRLETLLNNAGLVWETLRQRYQRDILLETTYAIMVEAGRIPLADTLQRICEAARANSGADWAIIYPLKPGGSLYEYDVANICYAGQLRQPIKEVVKEKTRQKGASVRILQTGLVVVPDIDLEKAASSQDRLANHKFIQREGVKALLGVAIRDERTAQPLGVLYLDYRVKHLFSDADIRLAQSFATLAAIAITNARQIIDIRSDAESLRQREREISYRMLESALAGETEGNVIQALVSNTAEALALSGTDIHTSLIMQRWQSASLDHEPRGKLENYSISLAGQLVKEPLRFPTRRSVRKAILEKTSILSSDQFHAYVPVSLGMSVFGVFHACSTEQPLRQEQIELLERFAQVSSLVLDNIQRHDHLVSVLDAAKVVTEPTDLIQTFTAVMRTLRKVSPELSAFTLWYVDAESENGSLKMGASFGVHQIKGQRPWNEGERTQEVIQHVMNRAEPIWADDIHTHEELNGRFVQSQKIISVAAFPLRADKEKTGAMFFNYRRPHHFTIEERTIFPLLAEIVAASIRDATRLETERAQREHLNIVLETTETIATILDLKTILQRVLSRLGELFEGATLCLMNYDEDANCLEFAPESLAFYPIDEPDHVNLLRLPLYGPSIACRVARETLEKRTMVVENINDVTKDKDYLRMRQSTRSELCVSLVSSEEKLLGILALERAQSPGFNQGDIDLVKMIARQFSLAIERAHQSDELSFKSTVAAAYVWAAEIAHDIKSEVGKIKSCAYLASEMANEPHKVREYTGQIVQSADVLTNVGPWKNPEPQILALDESIRKHVSAFANQRNITPVFDLHCPKILIQVNPLEFQRVLRQLVRNAAHAMQETDEKILTIRSWQSDLKQVEIQFEDRGPGVDNEVRPSIFLRPVTTKGKFGGYGLLITRQMVEDMGGKIRLLTHHPDSGAVFSIKLPIASQTHRDRRRNGHPDQG
ncbi:MAG: GAF domain-containing protein [Anaerolineales bacterium]|nr:GAF domain-containing protein [Anaerolineales bacterium]